MFWMQFRQTLNPGKPSSLSLLGPGGTGVHHHDFLTHFIKVYSGFVCVLFWGLNTGACVFQASRAPLSCIAIPPHLSSTFRYLSSLAAAGIKYHSDTISKVPLRVSSFLSEM